MGFFRKKMQELMEQNKKLSGVVCPYCFEKFDVNEIVFRAAHVDDTYKMDIDTAYNNYRKKLRLPEVGPMPAIIDPKEYNEEYKKYEGTVLTQIVVANEFATNIRLCPFCHNPVMSSAGKSPSNILSVIGASQVGKSVYMTALIHTLQNITSGNFNASCLAINQEMNRKFRDDYETPLFVDGRLLDPTQKERHQEPIIFEFKFIDTGKSLTLVFFDVAGEGMVDKEYLNLYAKHIKNSAGIMFLIDPSQIKTIRSKISLSSDGEAAKFYATDEPTDVLISLKDEFMEMSASGKISIPTAVVLTKSDMLSGINDDNYLKNNSNIFSNYVHSQYFNNEEYANINGEVEMFIEKVDKRFYNALRANFDNTGFFAVSALGRKPIEQKINSVIEPLRVDEPFLWLLYKLGYINAEGGTIDGSAAILHKRKKRAF